MPRSEEITYFSQLLASLVVTIARARRPEDLAELHVELAEAFSDVFSLLSHDTFEAHRRPELAERLFNAARAEARTEVRA